MGGGGLQEAVYSILLIFWVYKSHVVFTATSQQKMLWSTQALFEAAVRHYFKICKDIPTVLFRHTTLGPANLYTALKFGSLHRFMSWVSGYFISCMIYQTLILNEDSFYISGHIPSPFLVQRLLV